MRQALEPDDAQSFLCPEAFGTQKTTPEKRKRKARHHRDKRDHFFFRCFAVGQTHTRPRRPPFPSALQVRRSPPVFPPLTPHALLTPRHAPAAGNEATQKKRKNRDEKDERRKDDDKENDGVERDGPCLVSPRQLDRRSGPTGAPQLGN